MSPAGRTVRAAGVDCGTNTIKLLIVDVDVETGEETELARETRMVRLGQGVDASGSLADEALARVFAAVEEYAALIAEHDVAAIRFCATSAVRDSSNADVFSSGVEARLGVAPEVLSGQDEAHLSYAGAIRGLTRVESPVLVVDIGGGSTELVLGEGHHRVLAAHSLDIGSVRLTERHLRGDPPTAEEVAALRRTVDEQLDALPSYGVDLGSARSVVAVSGTGLTVTAAVLDLPRLDRDLVDRQSVSVHDVSGIADRFAAMTVAERAALPFMPRGREDVIHAGALVLQAVLARTTVETLSVSVSDILDGVTWSAAQSWEERATSGS